MLNKLRILRNKFECKKCFDKICLTLIFYAYIHFQWDLVCDRNQLANFAQSCTMFGILIGNMIFSSMSDR